MREIHYLLGNSCNLNCDFCFWDVRMPDVSLDFKKKIVDEIIKSGIKKVTISGGEPLCTNNLLEILDYMKQNNLEVVLHTNGLKIDNFLAQKIAPLIYRISLTMDAVETNTQFQMRKNKNITNHTIDLIKIFHNLNISINIKTLVTKINKNEIRKIGKILCDLPIKYWSLLEFIPLNRGKLNQSNFLLQKNEFDVICAKIKNEFPSMDIRTRKFADTKDKYCFIAPNGDVYTHVKEEGDSLVGNINSNELNSLIKKIEYTSVPLRHTVPTPSAPVGRLADSPHNKG
jgi:MoaA/NifB/PqqE/SkfB family radical SAM enzyme